MFDAVIIGAGPAGISASLYLKRASKNVLVLYYGESQLEKAHKIDNYYGFKDGISGKDLYLDGITQAKNLGIEVKNEEVLNVKILDINKYEVETTSGSYETSNVIIATGNKKLRPNVKGILDFEGRGVSYCVICDGFFFRKKKVVVIGNGNYALHEARDLSNVTDNITILTNGEPSKMKDTNYPVDTRKISEIRGEEVVKEVIFDDGSKMDVEGVFIALGTSGGVDYAKKLGVLLDKDNFKVNENMETNVPGIYACGNLTGGLLQVNKAVYEGAVAALSIVNKLNNRT